MKKRHQQKLVVLSISLFLLLNAPILLLFDLKFFENGFPVIYLFIFMVWLGSSIATWLVFKKFDE